MLCETRIFDRLTNGKKRVTTKCKNVTTFLTMAVHTVFTHIGNGHSNSGDVQQLSHGSDFGQWRRHGGRGQHYRADDDGGQTGGHVHTGFLEYRLAVQQHHVDAAELLPGDHGAGYDHCLDVAAIGEQFAETGLLFLRVFHGFLCTQRIRDKRISLNSRRSDNDTVYFPRRTLLRAMVFTLFK